MSTTKIPKSLLANESNIPIPKKTQTGIRKSKRCAQLPELQKYIETIIKASNECDSEDTSLSDRDRFPKDRKFARHSVFKGLNNKFKHEKLKNDLNLGKSKNCNKEKTPISEAVSRGDKLSISFGPEFEDPRNWKLNATDNSGLNVEIEKILKKFYPNPYHLESVNEFKDSKGEKDELRDGTLPDVVISKANINAEVEIEKRDNDLVTADTEINLCKRESKDRTLSSDPCEENNSSQSSTDCKSTDDSNRKPICNLSVPVASKKSLTSSISSRGSSSPESFGELLCKDNSVNSKKRKILKSKSKFKISKSEKLSDYDIGKLQLLSLSDSEESLRENKNDENVSGKNSMTVSDELYKVELNDMKEIYDVMNKATESFFQISTKNKSTEELKMNEECESIKFFIDLLNDEPQQDYKTSTTEDCESRDKIISTEDPAEEQELESLESSLNNSFPKEETLEKTDSTRETTTEKVGNEIDLFFNEEPNSEDSFITQEKEKCDILDAHQKIDEVLSFMYDCLKKFREKEKQLEKKPYSFLEGNETIESIMNKKFKGEEKEASTSQLPHPTVTNTDSSETILANDFTQPSDPQNTGTTRVDEINNKQFTNSSPPRKPELCVEGLPSRKPEQVNPESENLNVQPENNEGPQPIIRQNTFTTSLSPQTAERQNELGGYAEENPIFYSLKSRRISKQILPLSTKPKSDKNCISKTLKDALEEEEKLLLEVKTESKKKDKFGDLIKAPSQGLILNEVTSKVFSQLETGKTTKSNFVICVNSFPRNVRSFKAVRSTISLPVSISLSDVASPWNSKRLSLTPKYSVKKLSPPEVVLKVQSTAIAYNALPICLKAITSLTKPVEEFSLRNSERLLRVMVQAIQQSVAVKSSKSECLNPTNLQSENIICLENVKKPVSDLIKAIEETEEKLLFLEQNAESSENLYCRNSELCNYSTSETIKNESSDYETEKENDRKKIYELLLRTYNLQQKLERYLQKMTFLHSPTLSCPLVREREFLDVGIVVRDEVNTEFTVKPDYPPSFVHWHLNSPLIKERPKVEQGVAVNVQMVDTATTYDPPSEEPALHKSNEKYEHQPELEKEENDEDDQSSNYSFKSSIDFSEVSEEPHEKRDSVSKRRFIKKLFNDIETYQQNLQAEEMGEAQSKESEVKSPESLLNHPVTQYDPKTQGKVLKTVFKGKGSSTELTIGLKDVPMTNVGNISVEKTKFSPNHTKISICISREHSIDHDAKFSSYIFDHMKPSLSLTDYLRPKDEVSKSSQSANEESDDNEDDYKSVCSTVGNSDSEEEKKSKTKSQKKIKVPTSKGFTKHRFDFYHKMNLDLETNKAKHKSIATSICRYKELEPLKEALTEMQIRMRSIKRDALYSSNDYYERALKLAKMSAGFCQTCGNRAVIPNDTFGYYKTLIPRKSTYGRRTQAFRANTLTNPTYHSCRPCNPDINNAFRNVGFKYNPYSYQPAIHSKRTVMRSSLQDMPILFEGV